MKKYGILLTMAILFVFAMSGCMQSPVEDPVDEESMDVIEETEELEEAEDLVTMIENPDNYEEAEIDTFGLTPCPDYPEMEELIEEAENAGIKQLVVFESDTTEIVLYMTPNVSGIDNVEFLEVNNCLQGAGGNAARKALDEYLLWGYPYCTAGVIPDPELQPDLYEEYTDCIVIQDELEEYFEN